LIIDALLVAESSVWSAKIAEALVAARELKALTPMAWITDNYEQDRSATTYSAEMANRWRDKGWRVTPLYALDEVNHVGMG